MVLTILMLHEMYYVMAEFVYSDFNQTLGLVFNGHATTSTCRKHNKYIPLKYSKEMYDHTSILSQVGLVDAMQRRTQIMTANITNHSDELKNNALFGHRESFQKSPDNGCRNRLRLTSSYPSQSGSVWYDKRLPVLKGFSTDFVFQVTDHSQECSFHVDPSFSLERHKSCAVHGGDGFAFVIHSDPNATSALGKNGQDIGYGGMKNALAIEFDMWTNVGRIDNDDFFEDHVSIHSCGKGVIESTGQSSALGYARAKDLADGKKHMARICYLPYIATNYFKNMTANENLIKYLKDNGEGRRLGTIVVFIDDGIEDDVPILAIPLNLSVLLNLSQSLAYVGFTASTGRKWEKHDILSWSWSNIKTQTSRSK